MSKVELAKSAGFCFGVKRAIEMAYKQIENNEKTYSYGPLIHNKEVTGDLEKKGLAIIESLDTMKEGSVLVRSHGVGKEIYDALEEKGLQIVDGTCPFVKKIHMIVKEHHDLNKGVIIAGSSQHPEVIGINGWCENDAQMIETPEEAAALELQEGKKYILVVQTTFRRSRFDEIVEELKKKNIRLEVFNTICSATEERQAEAVSLSKKVDKMIVIGDKKSSNTQKLVEICRKNCKNTVHIETICDLVLNNFSKDDKIG
ncbi:MAG: 4-hydroxy-3-methylbut-2-enyl diphosphate reductase, partial [Anaerotignum sp.]|nr:4-hydroxy-3-methylbut-2-enyl diphosphate reductase [Anaerotignum sp.]